MKIEIKIEKRSICAKPRRWTYDAHAVVDGERFSTTAPSSKEAKAELLRDIEYVRKAGSVEGAGFLLYAQGHEQWVFKWPKPHSGSYCFGAKDLQTAFARIVEDYPEHEEIQAFVRAVREKGLLS